MNECWQAQAKLRSKSEKVWNAHRLIRLQRKLKQGDGSYKKKNISVKPCTHDYQMTLRLISINLHKC